jgi:hypothetical protein
MSLLQAAGDADEAGAAGHIGKFERQIPDVFGDVANTYLVAVRHANFAFQLCFGLISALGCLIKRSWSRAPKSRFRKGKLGPWADKGCPATRPAR